MGQIRYATFSECGARRDNEDYCEVVVNPDKDRYLFVVCDGMGGHAMGEVASQVICTTICDYWNSALVDSDTETVLKGAFYRARSIGCKSRCPPQSRDEYHNGSCCYIQRQDNHSSLWR